MVAAVLMGAPLTRAADEASGLKQGETAPLFTGKVLNTDVVGVRSVALDQLLTPSSGKKAVILSFFATYCEPCKKELPFLEALHQKYKDQGLQVLVVSIDKSPEEIAKVGDLAKEKNLTYPVLSDRFNIVAKRYGVSRLPCLYVLDPAGKISMVNTGYTEEFSGQLLAAVQTRLGVPLDDKAVAHAGAPVDSTVVNTAVAEPSPDQDAADDDKPAKKKKKRK